jgi:uncharacterized membrane protein
LDEVIVRLREVTSLVLGAAFVWVGIQHFWNVEFFAPIVPNVLGFPHFWVYASGIAEITLGLGMIYQRSRKQSALATASFLVIVYWANFNMWVNDIPIDGTTFSTQAHIGRAFAQFGMIATALWIAEIRKESV